MIPKYKFRGISCYFALVLIGTFLVTQRVFAFQQVPPVRIKPVKPLSNVLSRTRVRALTDTQVAIPLRFEEGQTTEDFEVLAIGPQGLSQLTNRITQVGLGYRFQISRDQYTLLRSIKSASLELSSDRAYLPGMMIYSPRPVSSGERPHIRSWELFLRTRNDPITWRDDEEAYYTRLVVGVDDSDIENQTSSALPIPLIVQFFPKGEGIDIKPRTINLVRSGPAGYGEAEIWCWDHSTVPGIEIKTDLGSSECTFEIRPSLGYLVLAISKTRIMGIGMESTTLTVCRFAEDGRDLLPDKDLDISLTANRGLFLPGMTIPAGLNEATTDIRSTGVGETFITASTGLLHSEPAILKFVLPWVLVLTTIIFAGVGGLVRVMRLPKEQIKPSGPPRRRQVIQYATVGAFTGVVIVFAITTGLRIYPTFSPQILLTEAGAAVIAAVTGYAGPRLLDSLVQFFFG